MPRPEQAAPLAEAASYKRITDVMASILKRVRRAKGPFKSYQGWLPMCSSITPDFNEIPPNGTASRFQPKEAYAVHEVRAYLRIGRRQRPGAPLCDGG